MGNIRPIAIGIFIRDGAILVFEGHDGPNDRIFYRPLGGGIDYGEHSRDTLVREMREEIGAEVTALRYLGTLENIFVHEDEGGHEIVQVYVAEFVDPSFYEQREMTGVEDDGTPFKVLWKPLTDFKNGGPPIYPDGLLELLDSRYPDNQSWKPLFDGLKGFSDDFTVR